MSKFINLHVHTADSVQDAVGKIEDYVKEAKRCGQRYLGVTEHGHLNSSYRFYKACAEENIIPIIGCEFYQSEVINKTNEEGKRIDRKKNHILVFVKNMEGWKNILKLNHISFNEPNFYYRPTISFKDLIKHKEGLIILIIRVIFRI